MRTQMTTEEGIAAARARAEAAGQVYRSTMSAEQFRRFVAQLLITRFLDDAALALSYGPEDAYGFLRWLDERYGLIGGR